MGIFNVFESKEKKNRMNHMLNLISVACADGELEQAELDLILKIGVRLGVSGDELRRIIKNPGSIKFSAPESDFERIAQLYDMVMVMLVNGDIDETEKFLCKERAIQLGFSPRVIDILVAKVIELATQKVDNEKAVETIKETIS